LSPLSRRERGTRGEDGHVVAECGRREQLHRMPAASVALGNRWKYMATIIGTNTTVL
jgi:hypothetical protein